YHRRNLCPYQRHRQACVYGCPALLALTVLDIVRGTTGAEDGQSYIRADKQLAQRLGADIAVATFLITEAQERLSCRLAQRPFACTANPCIDIVQFVAVIRRTKATKRTMPIEMHGVARQ